MQADYVIVGAGSAGCVLANRLTEDPATRVVLIEAGGRDWNPLIHIPAGFMKLLDHPSLTWGFKAEADPGTNGRAIPYPRGRVLGGSSSINGLIYIRGQPEDFDHWAQLGNRGWGWDDVLPYFKRAEDWQGEASELHGNGGFLTTSPMSERPAACQAIIEAAQEVGLEYRSDVNNLPPGAGDSIGWCQQTRGGRRRASAARTYLRPASRRPNLQVVTKALAHRVLFDGKRAVGLECRRGGATVRVSAHKEVILSAGPLQSPKLLELSGVGRPEILARYGVGVVHALPGVGENLSDHPNVRLTFECSQPITINDVLQRPLTKVKEGLRYALFGTGLLSICSATAHIVMRSRPGETQPDLKLQLQPFSGKDRYARRPQDGLDPHPGFTVGVMALRPRSRGYVHLASADPLAFPTIDPNYLADASDADVLLVGIKAVRALAKTPALSKFVVRETRPGPEVRTDEQIRDYIRATTQTTWHVVGSCKMGNDADAVVDAELRVRGVDGLRVIDSSVFPTIPSSNTNAATIALGEKGADLVLNSWRNAAAA